MKNLYVVSKTHLDLGFTDYAENIEKKYINEFFPNAIQMAEKLNLNSKNFVWTTGSWIINQALDKSSLENKKLLIKALKKGNISPHAMAFTTHTELLDWDTLDYSLSIVDEIDKITGNKTIAAKMTDVPGHTIGVVPLLAKHGIKLLHIGVNGASALPKVPPCFLWKSGESEVVVIYSGDYGGEFKCDFIDDILYFDHSLDNRGVKNPNTIIDKINKLKTKYPDYNVVASSMNEYAEKIWAVKDKLPVVTDEIGDSWIHGSSSDPYKSAALRTLINLKNQWLSDGSLTRNSEEYVNLADNILCLAEHTCGMDMKCYFADYEHYLRKDFEIARKNDYVKMNHLFRDFPQNFLIFTGRLSGGYKKGSYKTIEKSWLEQREYITKALTKLSSNHKQQAEEQLKKLIPKKQFTINNNLNLDRIYKLGNYDIKINGYGGIEFLSIDNVDIVKNNLQPAMQYVSYGQKDYDFWLKNYTRNIKSTISWAIGDFARPLLKYVDNKYKQGRFNYVLRSGEAFDNKIIVSLSVEEYCFTNLGAAKNVQLVYSENNGKLSVEVYWFNKPANRLTESTILTFYPNCSDENLRYSKVSTDVNPYDIVVNGNRNLSAVEKVTFDVDCHKFDLINIHSPLASVGKGKILRFDNKFESVKDGLSYILHNNVWGTNFPLWYEDNAYFKFEIVSK